MKRSFVLVLTLLILLGLGLLHLGNWIGPPSKNIQTVKLASFNVLQSGKGENESEDVALPHRWPRSLRESDELAIYRISIPPHPIHEVWAISISEFMPGTSISVDHHVLNPEFQTDHISEVIFAELPSSPSPQTIEIRVPAHFGLWGGLGTTKLGPSPVLEKQVRIVNTLREAGQLSIVGMTLTVALLALGAYLFRSNSALLALAAAAGGMCIRQALPLVTGYWTGDDAVLSLYIASMTLTGAGIFFMVEQGSRHTTDGLSRVVLLSLAIIVMLHFLRVGGLEFRRELNVTFFLTLAISGWVKFGKTIIQQRQLLLIALLSSLTLRAFIALQSTVSNHGQFGFDDNERLFKLMPLGVVVILIYGSKLIYQSVTKYESTKALVNEEISAFKSQILETKEQEKKLAVDQASETERLRWLHEIHDGLGSHLIAARFLADKAKSLEDFEIVKQSIDEGIEELRELVDSLSPEPSTLPELLGAMRYRITNRFESAGITLRWIVEPMIEAGDLSPIEALHVQRIAQEALTNILKHANASTVCVHIFTQGPLMILRIDDDGAGFDRKGEQRGNGLVSMEARAQKIGGEITLSNLASGTRVELIISNI